MKSARSINRRSFLGRVLGSAVVGGPALAIVAGRAAGQERQMVVDADPSDPARPQVTDRDEGATADPANLGRGGVEARRQGVSDADGGPAKDPPGSGRGPVQRRRVSTARPSAAPRTSGVSDSDSGANADAAGHGRGGSASGAPTSRFVSCPRHPRCPRGPGS
jgi:hypothetical protein